MLHDSSPEPSTGIRNYAIVSVLVFLVVGSYIGWVFYSRWEDNQVLEQKAQEKERAEDRKTFEMMGGDKFAILGFYADTPTISIGGRSDLCYSVSNAKSVKLEPQPEPVWPAFSHCVEVSPRQTTKYTLTAEDGEGHIKTATIEVKVR
jgi:hypothetical protein